MAHVAAPRLFSAVLRQCGQHAASSSGRTVFAARLAAPRWRPAMGASLLTVRAASGGGEGQLSSEVMARMRGKISAAMEAQLVEVQDMQGDGRHVEISVVSKDFEGKSAVNRQRMVYKAIWEELQDTVHAVDAMVTRTPAEAGM